MRLFQAVGAKAAPPAEKRFGCFAESKFMEATFSNIDYST
jgi:hypothetical protein